MKRKLLPLLLFVLLGFILSILACKDNPVSENTPSELIANVDTVLAKQIDDYLATLDNEDAGLSIMARYNGEIVYYGSRGMGNKGAGVYLNENSFFRLASVSKVFTAVAIMQMVDWKQLNLDDSILKYFPEFDDSWEPITISMLLNHRAGTVDFLNDFAGSSARNGVTNEKVIQYFIDNPRLKFTPNSQTGYSNSNYLLLAEIIHRISGISFAEYMKTFIFKPLKMEHTYFRDSENPLKKNEVLFYADRETFFNIRTYTVGPMGMVSSTYELDLFMKSFFAGKLVSKESKKLMLTPYSELFGNSYGYGLMFGSDWYGHGGSLDGAQTNITFYPDRNVHLVILTNGGGRTYNYLRKVTQLIEQYYN